MKERVLLQGIVSEVSFPCKGKLIPTECQVPVTEADTSAGFLYVEPTRQYDPFPVKNLLPGQNWLVSTGIKGRRAKECHPIRLIEKAPYEIEPSCVHAEYCGGCLYQTVPYAMQTEWKESQVKDLLKDVPGIDEAEWISIQESPILTGYRNKMEFSFGDAVKGGEMTVGLHRKNSAHDVISAAGCTIVHPDLSEILKVTETYFRETGLPYYNTYGNTGILRHLVLRRSFKTGGTLVNLVATSELKEKEGVIEGWVSKIEEMETSGVMEGAIEGILYTENNQLADAVKQDVMHVLRGKAELTEELLGLSFKIFPFSFFQTNTLGAEKLYSIVRDFAGDVADKTVFDLYCGTGTIAQVMAAAGAKEVKGIEIVEEAIDAAKENAAMNGLDNCFFVAGDVLKEVENLDGSPDLIILDPPREGCHPKALPKLLSFAPKQFIYVSCKPTSLVRDLPVFVEAGYHIDKVQTCDMFPMTPHVETVVLLSRDKEKY